MKFKKIFQGKKKKKQTVKLISESLSNEESTIPSNNSADTASTFSSEECQQQSNDFVLRRYSDSVDGSAMTVFAKMSTTIAETLSEKEFGTQKNILYRPNTTSYTSKVVHPVLCKRDIFVQSVTPTKQKGRKNKKLSIYHIDNKAYNMVKGKNNRETNGNKAEKENSFQTNFHDNRKEREQEEKLKIEDRALAGQNDDAVTNDVSNSDDNASNLASQSISASMLFRERKQLSVETGRRISSDENQTVRTNPHRLHYVQAGDYPTSRHTKDWGRPPRFATTAVSPSSTVSSLTMPAELELDPTPRALFHLSVKSSRTLEGIQEVGDSDDFVKSQSYQIEDDDYNSEI